MISNIYRFRDIGQRFDAIQLMQQLPISTYSAQMVSIVDDDC